MRYPAKRNLWDELSDYALELSMAAARMADAQDEAAEKLEQLKQLRDEFEGDPALD